MTGVIRAGDAGVTKVQCPGRAARPRWRGAAVLTTMAASLAALVTATPAQAVPLESQAWWSDERGLSDGQSAHAHSEVDFPLFGSVSGSRSFDVVSKLHNEPAGTVLDTVRIQASYGGGTTLVRDSTDRVCNEHDCTFTTPLTVPFDSVRRGLLEIRVHSQVKRPNGESNLSTTGWFLHNAGGTSTAGYTNASPRFPTTEFRGRWDTVDGTQLGYQNVLLRSLPPTGPVCGPWRVRVQTKPGSGGSPITSSRIALDPKLHAVPEFPGTTLREGAGAFDGWITIDTALLADGPHALVGAARADVSEPAHPAARLAGAARIPFTVANGDMACRPQPAVEMQWPEGAVVNGNPTSSVDANLDAATPPGTTKVEYLLDGRPIATDASTPTFDEQVDLDTWPDGTHTLQARATTPDGPVLSPPVTFKVDN